MTRTVAGVHGIGNHHPDLTPSAAAALLGSRWTATLQHALAAQAAWQPTNQPAPATETSMAYYAHHLAVEVPQSAPDPETLSAAECAVLLAWSGALGAPTEVAQGRLTAPARVAAEWIADRSTGPVRRFIARFCREVATYLDEPERRAAARATVAETLDEVAGKVVLAHSLGSVVAYEALWARPDIELDLLITLGSPLGLPGAIFDRLDPAPVDGRGSRPPGVRRWVNIADPGDLVALPRAGLATRFDGVDADITTSIGVADFHKVSGYLASPATATALLAVL